MNSRRIFAATRNASRTPVARTNHARTVFFHCKTTPWSTSSLALSAKRSTLSTLLPHPQRSLSSTLSQTLPASALNEPTTLTAASDAPPPIATPGVARWLIICAHLVIAVVVVGGVTRLTESGLSITEWKPVTGVLPPLSAAEWDTEFEKYKATPEFKMYVMSNCCWFRYVGTHVRTA